MKLSITMIAIVLLLLVFSVRVEAVVQANGSNAKEKTIGVWMQQIREMEQVGGALGLTETLNTDLTASSESNNLDCHMEKNTEYGAMVILAASAYGNPNKIISDTTTGNKTGIYMKWNSEVVAAGPVTSEIVYKNAASKYKDDYTTIYAAKRGDAIEETKGWHGTSWYKWLNGVGKILVRAYGGSIYSYEGETYNYTSAKPTRAVVVVGEGL